MNPEPKNLAALLEARANASSEVLALVHQRTRLTWGQLRARARRVADQLFARGVRRGDVVGILAPHSPAQVAALFGVAMVDAAFSMINPLLRPAQMTHQLNDAAMKVVIGCDSLREHVSAALAERGAAWVSIDESGQLDEPETPGARPPPRNIPVDVATLIYTSGSTGRPKGVVVPHKTVLDGARIVSGYLGLSASDRILSILPLGFDYGLNQLLTAVRVGARLVMHNHVMASDLLRVLEREEITGLAAVPSLWPGVFASLRRRREPLALSSLRYITTAGGAHSPALLRELDEAFPGTEVIVMYGLTESFRSTYLPYTELHERPGCIGRPVPEVEILVVDEQGERCAPGVKGELVHRGAFVTYGYLNNPELTAKRFIELPGRGPGCIPERAVRSGDLVSMSEDGFLYFHGRIDMQIKSRGYRISPDEVAEAVMKVEGVRQVAVYGLPDRALGQRVVAAYESDSGETINRSTFAAQLADQLPSYAIPRDFCHHEALPRTANGKLDVTRTRSQHLARISEPAS